MSNGSEAYRAETRVVWVAEEQPPEGWERGNQCFVGDCLEVFFFDPSVPYKDRKQDGSTDRWIRFRAVTERRFVTEWETVDA